MPGPPTSRAVAEEIARSYEKFDRHQLINILSYLTKVYVVDGTMPFNSMLAFKFWSSGKWLASMAIDVIPASNMVGISLLAISTSFCPFKV